MEAQSFHTAWTHGGHGTPAPVKLDLTVYLCSQSKLVTSILMK
jgi:hypothetical protein